MNSINKVDIVTDLSWGDTGKGKVTSFLCKNSEYDFVCRWAGGNNAGHTVFIDGKKYKTHLIPSGIFHGITSIIGPACVLNLKAFKEEIAYLDENGFDTSLIKVSPKTNIVTEEHIREDKEKYFGKLGTTAKGIAPAYAAKMARTGILARDIIELSDYMWDERLHGNVLCEGAQGYYLDIDWGNYPYVTSSTTLPYGACSLGFATSKIKEIWGLCKAYDTRSGIDSKFPDSLLEDPQLMRLGDIGEEFGVTTGRRRKCNWLSLDCLNEAIERTGTTRLVVNKCDILEKLGDYRLFHGGKLKEFESMDKWKLYIMKNLPACDLEEVNFSSCPENI